MGDRNGIAIWLLAATALVGGCSFAPPPVHPGLPTAQTFPPSSLPGDGGSAAADGWQSFFVDGEIRALVTRALANNRDLRAAAARIEQARMVLRARGGDLMPQVSGSVGAARVGLPDNLSLLTRDDTLSSYDGLLQTSWEIDLFGRLRGLRAAALEQYLASSEAWRGIATSLVAQVAVLYLTDRELAERLALARDTLTNREGSLRLLERRYAIGSGSRIEVTQAETLRTQAAGEIQALELARIQNLNALSLVVGEPVQTADLTHSLAAVGLDQPIGAGLPSGLLVNRPDVAAAEHRLRQSEANIGAARAAFLPNISLTGVAGSASADLDDLFGGGTGLWLFRPTISLPIFTGGRLRANLRASEAQRDEMLAAYEKAIQEAFRDVADALAQRHWIAEQIGTAKQSLAALAERTRLARFRYESGRAAYLEVLDAERDRFSAEQRLVQLRRAWLASGVALYAALGGGFPQDTAPGQGS